MFNNKFCIIMFILLCVIILSILYVIFFYKKNKDNFINDPSLYFISIIDKKNLSDQKKYQIISYYNNKINKLTSEMQDLDNNSIEFENKINDYTDKINKLTDERNEFIKQLKELKDYYEF